MERHEIPTHLEVADRAFLGLTMRQLLSAAIGLAIAYGALADLPLPFGLRLVLVVVVIVATAVLVLWRPGGRPAEEWAFVLLRYSAAPRLAVWRPQGRDATGPAIHEVVVPAAPHEATAWKERVDAS
ncbi:MAG: PrgI family protein [Dehalococcoidia bacterium]|nr:PrgI family protein [Dehalococcoidia bacterium]